jgi:hypothetical protein
MVKKVIVVYSDTQDECTLCNRVFEEDAEGQAWKYLQAVEKNVGCTMKMMNMQFASEQDV